MNFSNTSSDQISSNALSSVRSPPRNSQKRVLRPPYFAKDTNSSSLIGEQNVNIIKTHKQRENKMFQRFNQYSPVRNNRNIEDTKIMDRNETNINDNDVIINKNDLIINDNDEIINDNDEIINDNDEIINDNDEIINKNEFIKNGLIKNKNDITIDDNDINISIDHTSLDMKHKSNILPSSKIEKETTLNEKRSFPEIPSFNIQTNIVRERIFSSASEQDEQHSSIKILNTPHPSPEKKKKSQKPHVKFHFEQNPSKKDVQIYLTNNDIYADGEEDPRVLSPKLPPPCKGTTFVHGQTEDIYIRARHSKHPRSKHEKSLSSCHSLMERPPYVPYGSPFRQTNSPRKKSSVQENISIIKTNCDDSLAEFIKLEKNLKCSEKKRVDLNYLKVLKIVRDRLQDTTELSTALRTLKFNQKSHILLLLTHPFLQLDGIYTADGPDAKKIWGDGPATFTARQVDAFWLYNVNTKGFDLVNVRNFQQGVDAVALHL